MDMSQTIKPKVAVLVVGTYREIEFLLRLFPYMAGDVDYDLFCVLRHVYTGEKGRTGATEVDFDVRSLVDHLDGDVYLCELPCIDPETVKARYLIPVGPTDEQRECGQLSMFHGVFAAVSLLKSAMRPYSHVMKTRTDYLPWVAPWVDGMIELYDQSGGKIIVDGCMTKPQRYPDRLDIPWQGSLCDVFCFTSYEQFLSLWDFEDILQKVWTGIAETTLFRAAMARFLGDDRQSPRRNNSFLQKYFIWEPNETKQSFHLLREGILPAEVKETIVNLLEEGSVARDLVNKLLRTSYDFIILQADEGRIREALTDCFDQSAADEYLGSCREARANLASACPHKVLV